MIRITSINIQREVIDISTHYEVDPDWVHVDEAGTEHRYHYDERGYASLPTLTLGGKEAVYEDCPCCGHERMLEPDESWWEDPFGMRIEPGIRYCQKQSKPGVLYWNGTCLADPEDIPACGSEFELETCAFKTSGTRRSAPPIDDDMVIHGRALITSMCMNEGGVYECEFEGIGQPTVSVKGD